jgi:1,4-alpha-glucan branching enzyme
VSPLAGLAAAAAFTAVIVGATLTLSRGGRRDAQRDVAAATAARPQVVQFVIAAPSAHDVALVGDFNGWNPAATPLARGAANGTWVVTLPLAAGRYQYAFVVDGRAWVADPRGAMALEDEFGAPSSLLTVGGQRT